jgi:hypothetical protein
MFKLQHRATRPSGKHLAASSAHESINQRSSRGRGCSERRSFHRHTHQHAPSTSPARRALRPSARRPPRWLVASTKGSGWLAQPPPDSQSPARPSLADSSARSLCWVPPQGRAATTQQADEERGNSPPSPPLARPPIRLLGMQRRRSRRDPRRPCAGAGCLLCVHSCHNHRCPAVVRSRATTARGSYCTCTSLIGFALSHLGSI